MTVHITGVFYFFLCYIIAGVKIFGASNIRRNKTQLYYGMPNCEFVLTYTFEDLKEKIHVIYQDMFGIIIIQILTNDIMHICQKNFKSNVQKKKNYMIH